MLYCTTSVPPFSTYSISFGVREPHARARVVGADAGDDGVVLGEVAAIEVGVGEQRDVVADLAQRVGDVVARAHDVADARCRGFLTSARTSFATASPRTRCARDVRVVDVGDASTSIFLPSPSPPRRASAADRLARRRRDDERGARLVALLREASRRPTPARRRSSRFGGTRRDLTSFAR